MSASCASKALTHNQVLEVLVKILPLDAAVSLRAPVELESIRSTKHFIPHCMSICSPDFVIVVLVK